MSADKETASDEIIKEISQADKFKNEANEYFKSTTIRLFCPLTIPFYSNEFQTENCFFLYSCVGSEYRHARSL